MYEQKISRLKEVPVFSLSDVSQIVSGKGYAKKLLRRMAAKGEVRRIKRDCYTFHDDPLLVSTFLVKPSYISSISALSCHRLITQIPKDVYCFTTKKESMVLFGSEIKFFHTDYFFGFEAKEHMGFSIPVATPEKAIIDSIGIAPFSVFEEAVEKIDLERMMLYIKNIRKSSTLKRAGFLLERNGFTVYGKISKMINKKYIPLDPIANKGGKKDKKWRLVVNA